MFYQKKTLLEKPDAIKIFEYSPLSLDKEPKKQTDIVKDQYKFFKNQINVVNNKREDSVRAGVCVKTENSEIIDNVHHTYFSEKYKHLIASIINYELMDGFASNKF